MTTLLIIIFAALFLVGMGVIIGYKYCAWVNGAVIQALFDEGLMMLKTEDGWQKVDK